MPDIQLDGMPDIQLDGMPEKTIRIKLKVNKHEKSPVFHLCLSKLGK